MASLLPDSARLVDIFALCLSAAMLGIYEFRRWRLGERQPSLTIQGINNRARTAWVEMVISENRDVMAVQTFRNSTMAASFLASTAILLIFGILNLMINIDKLNESFHVFNVAGSRHVDVLMFKIMVILVDFFVAFFSFSLAVRGYNHAGYLINVPRRPEGDPSGVTAQKVVQLLNRSAGYYSIGMRSYYVSVPLVLWLFGPLWLIVASVGMLVVLNHLDHLPD